MREWRIGREKGLLLFTGNIEGLCDILLELGMIASRYSINKGYNYHWIQFYKKRKTKPRINNQIQRRSGSIQQIQRQIDRQILLPLSLARRTLCLILSSILWDSKIPIGTKINTAWISLSWASIICMQMSRNEIEYQSEEESSDRFTCSRNIVLTQLSKVDFISHFVSVR